MAGRAVAGQEAIQEHWRGLLRFAANDK